MTRRRSVWHVIFFVIRDSW